MSKIAIGGGPNSGKTTAAMGSPSLGVTGLNPNSTLYIMAGMKTESPENIGKYRTLIFEDSTAGTVKPGPFEYNIVALTSAKISNIQPLLELIENAVQNGLKLYGGPVTQLTDIVIDDYQAFLNDTYYGTDLDAFKALKQVGNQAVKFDNYLAKLDLRQQSFEGYPLKRRIDIWLMFHMKPLDSTKKPGKGNQYTLHFAGKTMKDKYEIDGKYDTFLLAEKFKFYTKSTDAFPFVRIATGLTEGQTVSPQINADLAIIKGWLDNLYNKKFKK